MEQSNKHVSVQTREFTGTVVSMKMAKTVIVELIHMSRNSKYKKQVRKNRRFAVHNELPNITVGDHVRIKEVRPLSKTKHFQVIERIQL